MNTVLNHTWLYCLSWTFIRVLQFIKSGYFCVNAIWIIINNKNKLICLKSRRDHASPLLTQLHWLPINQRIAFKTLTYVYKSIVGLSPQYIRDCLIQKHSGSAMKTRSSGTVNFVMPITKKCAADGAFSVVAPRLWNHLPMYIRNATSVGTFKRMLKTHLFD